MKVLVGAFNQEKTLVGAFSVIVHPVVEPIEHYTALDLGQLDVELHAPLPRTRLEREPSLLLSFADRGQLEEISTHNQLNATERLIIILHRTSNMLQLLEVVSIHHRDLAFRLH